MKLTETEEIASMISHENYMNEIVYIKRKDLQYLISTSEHSMKLKKGWTLDEFLSYSKMDFEYMFMLGMKYIFGYG